MKQPVKFFALQSFLLTLFLILFNLVVLAQDSTSSSTTTTTTKKTNISVTSDNTTSTWYTSPWVWVVGAAIFILLLVALLSNRSGRDTVTTSDRVTVKKTVERDRDTSV